MYVCCVLMTHCVVNTCVINSSKISRNTILIAITDINLKKGSVYIFVFLVQNCLHIVATTSPVIITRTKLHSSQTASQGPHVQLTFSLL